MRTTFFSFLVLLFLGTIVGCSKKENANIGNLIPSHGERNEVVLVMDDSMWIGSVGDSIRAKLAKPITELSKEEPIFNLLQYDPKIFSSRARTSRNVVLFSVQTEQEFLLEKSFYATPQNFFFVRAETTDDLIKLFSSKADSIISVFQSSELNEEMHEIIRSSTQNLDELKSLFGCTLKIPNAYHLQMENDFPFLWYQRDLSSGNLNLILYEFSISEIENKSSSIENNLMMARNFIGKEFLRLAQENAYVMTSSNVRPIIKKDVIQNLPVYKLMGNWETPNDYLQGPFICYAIRDEYYDRYLFIEGFINNPFKNKRNQMMEMEAIMKTINFNENTN